MNLRQAKEALEQYEATHGHRYHIFIAPFGLKIDPRVLGDVVQEQKPMPETLLIGRQDLDVVFVERSKIAAAYNNGDPTFTKYLSRGAPEP